MDAAGGAGTLQVTINRECSWSARSDVEWVGIASGATGQGNGTVAYTVAPNAIVTTRRGNLLVNDSAFAVQQAGAPCVYRLDGSPRAFDAAGGAQSVGVAAQNGCSWTAVSHASWVGVSGASGNGDGSVDLAVDKNASPQPRRATVTIAGQAVMVEQAGLPPPSPAPTPTPTPAPTPAPAPSPTPTPAPQPAPTPNPTPTPAPPPTPEPPPTPAPTPPPQELKLEGEISNLHGTCPVLSFQVSHREVHTLTTTVFAGGNCSKLKNGKDATVTGTLQAGGFVLATRVDMKQNKQD